MISVENGRGRNGCGVVVLPGGGIQATHHLILSDRIGPSPHAVPRRLRHHREPLSHARLMPAISIRVLDYKSFL